MDNQQGQPEKEAFNDYQEASEKMMVQSILKQYL